MVSLDRRIGPTDSQLHDAHHQRAGPRGDAPVSQAAGRKADGGDFAQGVLERLAAGPARHHDACCEVWIFEGVSGRAVGVVAPLNSEAAELKLNHNRPFDGFIFDDPNLTAISLAQTTACTRVRSN